MLRPLVTIATLLSLLFGTGAFNIACWCGPCGPCAPAPAHAAATPAPAREQARESGCGGCCSKKKQDGAAGCHPVPADNSPAVPPCPADERCPCLYWTSVPLTTEAPTGVTLVKRLLDSDPVLLLEAVAPAQAIASATAATIRAGPLGPRDRSIRLQAWICVWTT